VKDEWRNKGSEKEQRKKRNVSEIHPTRGPLRLFRRGCAYDDHQQVKLDDSADLFLPSSKTGCLSSLVVSMLDSVAEGPRFKSQSRRCRVTVLGKLFTPIVPLFTK